MRHRAALGIPASCLLPLAIVASELTSGATTYRMGAGDGTGGGVGSVARRPGSKQKQRKTIIDNLEIEDG